MPQLDDFVLGDDDFVSKKDNLMARAVKKLSKAYSLKWASLRTMTTRRLELAKSGKIVLRVLTIKLL